MKRTKFASFVWFVLAYNVLVILWGAYVRATGSGAGCGSHWPLCNGEVLPRAPQLETMIEFTHRLSSGLAFLLVLVLFIWTWRAYPKGASVRLGAALSMFFIITEALVGAGLVLFEWVAHDASVGRVISMGVHLVNTFLLLASLTLTAWWASVGGRLQLLGRGRIVWLLGLGFLGMLLLGVSGAVTALGDTLFPADSLVQGMAQDFSPAAHSLVRLRVWHPVIAVLVSAYLIGMAGWIGRGVPGLHQRRFTVLLVGLLVIQLLAGLINLLLLAPVWMQIIHLLLADLVWITLVLLAATTCSVD